MDSIPEFSKLSLCSVALEMYFQETGILLSTGTAFFYRRHGVVFLITNWHNFSGLNLDTRKPISPKGGHPDLISVPLFNQTDNETLFQPTFFQIYHGENFSKPRWIVHPSLKQSVDVVALQINLPNGYTCVAINDPDLNFKDFNPLPADETFVLGYPYNIRQEGVFPIWKRASIASEPQFNYNNKPIILIDTATRSGMSGSPVILRRNAIWQDPVPGFGTRQCFLGIYSGRYVGDTEFEAQLGIVWKRYLIDEIIDGQTYDIFTP